LIYRLGMPILVSMAQLCAAVLALGRPDFAAAATFLAGGWPTATGVLASLELLVWTIVVGAVLWSLRAIAADVANRALVGSRWREGSVLAVGALVLAAGAFHHLADQVGMSGGTVQEAQRVLAR
jgi:hypothetical protein